MLEQHEYRLTEVGMLAECFSDSVGTAKTGSSYKDDDIMGEAAIKNMIRDLRRMTRTVWVLRPVGQAGGAVVTAVWEPSRRDSDLLNANELLATTQLVLVTSQTT